MLLSRSRLVVALSRRIYRTIGGLRLAACSVTFHQLDEGGLVGCTKPFKIGFFGRGTGSWFTGQNATQGKTRLIGLKLSFATVHKSF